LLKPALPQSRNKRYKGSFVESMPQLDWNATISSIREALPQTQFQNWFEPLTFIRCDERSVVLGVPSRFHEEWLRNNYGPHLVQAIREQCGTELQLEFEVLVREENVEASKSIKAINAPSRPNLRIVEKIEDAEEEEAAPLAPPPNLPAFTNAFLQSDYNHIAFQCARIFGEGKDSQINPLIILASVGMGKTHLLSDIGRQIHSATPTLNIRYTNAESFTAELVQSIKTDSSPRFKKKYREDTDVLLFDDVQLLSRRMRTQEELLHVFNEIIGRGGRVAFTTSIPPHRMQDFIEPLKSRLLSGVIAEIKPPAFEEKVELLKKICAQNTISVEEPVLRSLADKGQRDVRELIGSLLRLHLQARLENRSLDNEFLATEGWVKAPQKEAITLEEIVGLVEHTFGVSRVELMSKSRKSQTTWARQVAMYLARHYTLLPLEEIGKTFGRDHATVIHAFQKVTEEMANHPTRRYEVEFLKQKLQARVPRKSDECPL